MKKQFLETVFNVSGQMVSLTKKTVDTDTVTFAQGNVYDHEGTRISKTEDNVCREYYYCNGSVVYTEDNNALSASNLQNVDGSTFTTVRDEVYYNYLKNIQGSTSSIVNGAGATSAVYEYTDFGETEELTGGSFNNEICYTGAIYDASTGLYYLNARYYDPANARFISQDTYRGEIDDAGTWHLYAYCANDPVNYVDLSGHRMNWIGVGMQVSASASASFLSIGMGIEIVYFFKQIKSGVYAYYYHESGVSKSAQERGMKALYSKMKKNPNKLFSNPSFECSICFFAILSKKENTDVRSYEKWFHTVSLSSLGRKGFVSTGAGFLTGGAGKNFGNGGFSITSSYYRYIGSVSKMFGSLKGKIKEKAKKYSSKIKYK